MPLPYAVAAYMLAPLMPRFFFIVAALMLIDATPPLRYAVVYAAFCCASFATVVASPAARF